MTATIQITNIQQITYPPPGEDWRERACVLARMTNQEKQKIADTMADEIPAGKIAFKLPHPFGGNVVEGQPKYFCHVRYVQVYDPVYDEVYARMDLGYGDETQEEG